MRLAISAGYWERVPCKGRLIEKTVVVMTFEEAPACRLPHHDIIVDGQIVIVGAVSLAAFPLNETRLSLVTVDRHHA